MAKSVELVFSTGDHFTVPPLDREILINVIEIRAGQVRMAITAGVGVDEEFLASADEWIDNLQRAVDADSGGLSG